MGKGERSEGDALASGAGFRPATCRPILCVYYKTHFPRAKHSRVMFLASRAYVLGNFTLMSAAYFLAGSDERDHRQTIGKMIQQD